MQYQGSVVQALENVGPENVAYVANTLRQKYGRPGKPKEELVFEVCYYVPDRVVSRKDGAELVAKLIVDLQRPLPMEGMLVPRFPDKVERGYLDRVREFLLSEEGKYWIGSMLRLASNRGVGGTMEVGWSRPVQQMAERSVHPCLYSPPGYNPVAMMPDASLNETTMRPTSAMSVSDRPSGLVPGIPRAYGTVSDNGERFGVGELDQKVLNNKLLCAVLSCCGIHVVVRFLSIILV